MIGLVLLSCNRGADFYVHQTAVFTDTGAPFASHPDFHGRLESTIDAALRYCLAHPRWRLSLQTHKLLGIP